MTAAKTANSSTVLALSSDAPLKRIANHLIRTEETLPKHLVIISFRTPDELVSTIYEKMGVLPHKITTLQIGGRMRGQEALPLSTEADRQFVVGSIPDPANLTAFGTKIVETLDQLSIESSKEDTTIILDSLTGILQYEEEQEIFKFVHKLLMHLQADNSTTVVALDPEAHSNETVATFRTLFDDIVSLVNSREVQSN